MTPIDFAFDIETARDPHAVLPAVKISPGNTKDPMKLKIKQEEADAKATSKLALDPHFGRVVGFSCYPNPVIPPTSDLTPISTHYTQLIADPANYITNTPDLLDVAESKLISHLIPILSNASRFTSYNGVGFDLPFIQRRCLILGIPIPDFDAGTSGYSRGLTGRHLDVLLALQSQEPGYGRGFMFSNPTNTPRTLKFYIRRLLDVAIEPPEIDKANIAEGLADPTFVERLLANVTYDAEMTYRLARKYQATHGG